MKKKLLTLFMAMTMTAMLITGCGEKEDTKGDAKASVEENKEDDKEESIEESKEEVKEESEEVVEATEEDETEEVVESTEEVAESSEEADPTEEVVEVGEETEGEEATVVDADGKDWSNAYDDYFQRDDVMSDKMQFNCTAMAEDMTFDLIIAMADDNVRMSYIFDGAVFDMYATKEKVFAYCELQGQSQWIWAPVGSEDELDSLIEISDTGMVDTESVESVTYREALEDDGVIYDLVDVVSQDGISATFFINRETQKIEKCVSDQDGVTMVMLLEEIESVEIPAEAESATESTMDEVMMTMIGVILAGSGAMAQ